MASNIEFGYGIPALYVSPPLHMELVVKPKQQVYIVLIVGIERDRYGVDDSYDTANLPQILNEYKYNNQVSVGITADNSEVLNWQANLLQATDSEWVVIKEPVRVIGGQIQLVVFNDGDEAITIHGYELVTGDSGFTRLESGK